MDDDVKGDIRNMVRQMGGKYAPDLETGVPLVAILLLVDPRTIANKP